MPAVPYTAPRFTAEDEARENANLSAEAKTEIYNDLHGILPASSASDNLHDAKLLELSELLLSISTDDDELAGAYCEAAAQIPETVALETNLSAFLRVADNNVEVAAKRIFKCWSLRRRIFGEELWLLPMTLEGAMRNDDRMLRLAILEVLPNDKHGRPVVYYERARWDANLWTRESLMRIFFYVLSHLVTSPDQHPSVVFITNMRDYSVQYFDRKLAVTIASLLKDGLPIEVKASHVCYASTSYIAQFILPIAKFFVGQKARERTLLHVETRHELLAEELEQYGLGSENLPERIGGTYTRDHFSSWIEERRRLEN